jgi:hypothetical protein
MEKKLESQQEEFNLIKRLLTWRREKKAVKEEMARKARRDFARLSIISDRNDEGER